MDYRYKLEDYKGPGSRYECPSCHQKRVFARYIDTETGEHLSTDVGRCNREDKCGYHYTPHSISRITRKIGRNTDQMIQGIAIKSLHFRMQ